MQERFYESGSCVQKNCAILGVHPTTTGPICILSTSEEKPTLLHIRAARQRRSFREFSIIAELYSTSPLVCWRTCNLGAPAPCRAIPPRLARRTTIFSRFGK